MDTIFESWDCDFAGDVEAVEDEGLFVNEDNFEMIGCEEYPEMLEAGEDFVVEEAQDDEHITAAEEV